MRAALLLFTLPLLLGCTGRTQVSPAGPRPSDLAPGSPPAPPRAYYEVPGPVPPASSTEVLRTTRWSTLTRYKIPTRMPPELRGLSHAADDIEILLFDPWPRGERRPLIVMAPVLANSMLAMTEFASAFVRQGWLVAIVMRKEFDFVPATALAQAEGEFRAYVIQSRQALDWLLARDDVDPERVATFGVSAGAVIGVCAAAADPRPLAHVFVLAGGPLADVISDTREKRFVEYRQALQQGGQATAEELREHLRRTLRTDPVSLARRVDRDKVLLFLARHDRSIPTRYGIRLWEALGRPPLVWLPFGHKTSFVFLHGIATDAVRFIGGHFDAVHDNGAAPRMR